MTEWYGNPVKDYSRSSNQITVRINVNAEVLREAAEMTAGFPGREGVQNPWLVASRLHMVVLSAF